MADDFSRATVVLVAVSKYWRVHPPSISHPTATQQVDNTVGMFPRSDSPRRS
jgi:hypothetical protein